jgi:hypothetical protein
MSVRVAGEQGIARWRQDVGNNPSPLRSLRLCGLFLLLLVCIGAQQQREAQRSWWDRAPQGVAGHYRIKTDVPKEEARELARHLNVMYDEYSRRLASLPPRPGVANVFDVYIFATQHDYLETLRVKFGVDASGSGGLFFHSPLGSGLALWTETLPKRRIEHVMQHEGFHQFAHSRFADDLPIWVNEGLAEFFGESVLIGNRLILGQSSPRVINRVKDAIEKRTYIPFRVMLAMSHQQWGQAVRGGDASLQYHQAWSMVHFLVYGDGGRYQQAFERYLRLLNTGVKSDTAFVQVFGADLDAFDARWREYATDATPSAFVTALERFEFLAAGLLQLSKLEQYPETLDELRAALIAIDFTYTISTHGNEAIFKASDEGVMTIPQDDLTTAQPVLLIESAEAVPLRDRRLEEENRTPMVLRTENLEPKELVLKWVRDRESNEFSYRILTR